MRRKRGSAGVRARIWERREKGSEGRGEEEKKRQRIRREPRRKWINEGKEEEE